MMNDLVTFEVILCVLSFILFVINTIQLSVYICRHRKYLREYNEGYVSEKSWKRAIMSSISYTLFLLFDGLFSLSQKYSDTFNYSVIFIFNCSQATLWHLGQLFVYLYLLNRIRNDFKDTKYSINQKTVNAIYSLLALDMITYVATFIILLCRHLNKNRISIDAASLSTYGDNLIIGIFDMVISLIILSIYVSKLCKIGEDIYDNYSMEMDTLKTRKDTDLSSIISAKQGFEDKRDDISGKASKIIILGIIMIVISQIVYILGLFRSPKFEDNIQLIYGIIKVIHSCITPTLIVMGFPFMDSCYKCCCNRFDNCVKIYFMGKVEPESYHDRQYSLMRDYTE